MKRKAFLTAVSVYALLAVLFLPSCGNRDQIPRVDFYLDLSQPDYQYLNSIGGQVNVNEVLVFRAIGGYFAVQNLCSYDSNNNLSYNAGQDAIICPSCASTFHPDGEPNFGRATQPLISYTCQLNGNQLRVYTP